LSTKHSFFHHFSWWILIGCLLKFWKNIFNLILWELIKR
jgi:hypothetical protein